MKYKCADIECRQRNWIEISRKRRNLSVKNVIVAKIHYMRGVKGVWSRVTKNNFPQSHFTGNKFFSRFKENKNDDSWRKIDFLEIFIKNCKKYSQSWKIKTPNHQRTTFNFYNHESREYCPSRFTENNLVISRLTGIKNGQSRHHEKDLSPPLRKQASNTN